MRSLAMWWLALSALGWLTWPLVATVFRRTPGRGYAYARAFGLLLLSYAHWLLGMLGLLPNTAWSVWLLAGVLAVVGMLAWVRNWSELAGTLREEWRHLLAVELLFAGVCFMYAAHKSYDAAIDHTEEPMDFAFLNGILRSPRMPPDDPWLSGFPISYYYFGYLTVATLSRLTGLSSGVAYNLGLTHTLALFVASAYGLIHDLIRTRAQERDRVRRAIAFGVVGGLAIGMVGNLEGIFEWLRAQGTGSDAFYRWLGVSGLHEAPTTYAWLPAGGWWWWRASRVIRDHNILGKIPTVITEFPAFSFILGDLHPHVTSLPYAVMALGLALELYTIGHEEMQPGWWRRPGYLTMPLVFGALGFLNSWDLPTYLGVGIAAYALGRWRTRLPCRTRARDSLIFGLGLLVGSTLLYAPFYLGFHSQAQGIGVLYYAKTPLKHYAICLGLWLLPVLVDVLGSESVFGAKGTLRASGPVILRVWCGVFVLPWLGTAAAGGWGRTLLGLGALIVVGPWLTLLQSGVLAVLLVDLGRALGAEGSGQDADQDTDEHTGWVFSRLLVLVGVGLTYLAEFFYLRDAFDTRMNTVFKVYYQAWVIVGIGAILSWARLWRAGGWRRGFSLFSGLVLSACLYYPAAAAYTRGGGYRGDPTLDGTAFLRLESPEEYGAFVWLREHADVGDVLAEAPGKEFDASTNRLSAWTGIPTVLGWAGHEAQWRGDDEEVAKRIPEVEKIYTSSDQEAVLDGLRRYEVTYLYVGPYEIQKFDLAGSKLRWYELFLETCYSQGDVRLYRVPG